MCIHGLSGGLFGFRSDDYINEERRPYFGAESLRAHLQAPPHIMSVNDQFLHQYANVMIERYILPKSFYTNFVHDGYLGYVTYPLLGLLALPLAAFYSCIYSVLTVAIDTRNSYVRLQNWGIEHEAAIAITPKVTGIETPQDERPGANHQDENSEHLHFLWDQSTASSSKRSPEKRPGTGSTETPGTPNPLVFY